MLWCRDSIGSPREGVSPLAYYIARLEGKLNEIWVKHQNRVSEVETAGYIRDHLFYGLRKPLQEAIHAKFDNLMNDYMVLMQVARKAKGKHKQEKLLYWSS